MRRPAFMPNNVRKRRSRPSWSRGRAMPRREPTRSPSCTGSFLQIRQQAPLDLAAVLDTYYVATRYPDAIVGPLPEALPGQDDGRQALDLARVTLRWIERLLAEPYTPRSRQDT